jgi:hypothetical protein
MGGGQSKTNKLDYLSDSNSVRQRHDEKVLRREGVKNIGYVPRQQINVLDDQMDGSITKDDDRRTGTVTVKE